MRRGRTRNPIASNIASINAIRTLPALSGASINAFSRHCGIAATQIPPTATPTPEPSPISESVAVPINVKGAKDLGTLHIELVYDAAVLEAEGFELAELSQNALVEVNLDTPGRVVIGIIDTGGIKGDGPVVVISFKRIRQQGTSTLVLENVTAHSATTLIDVPTTVTSGTFSVSGGAISLLEIVFAGAK